MSIKKQQQKGRVSADRRAACVQTFQESTHCKPPWVQWAGPGAEHWQRWRRRQQAGIEVASHADVGGSGQNKAFKKYISVRTSFHFLTQKHVTHIYYWLSYITLSWKVTVKVAQLCPNLCDPMDYRYRDHGLLQARILEWVAVPFCRGSSQPRDRTQVPHIAVVFFTSWATREALKCDVDHKC